MQKIAEPVLPTAQPVATAETAEAVPPRATPPRYYLDGALRRPDSPGSILAVLVCIGICVATVIGAVSMPLMGGDIWAAAASVLPALCGGLCCGGMLYLDMTHEP